MDRDFFQLLRRIQREERNKGTLARVDNDFYKKLYSYIRALERSVANDPFGNNQILLNNAQRIATDICQTRESKISKAANSNICRSFHLFKKENPQFDLLDTTPLNLTDEEETLYFSLMDALKTHRYNISLDKFGEEKTAQGNLDYDEDEDDFSNESQEIDNSILESHVNPGVVSEEEFFGEESDSNENASTESEVLEGNSDADTLVEEEIASDESLNQESSTIDASAETASEDSSNEISYNSDNSRDESVYKDSSSNSISNESDEVLNRLNQIKNSTIVKDERYEPIEKQINNQAKVVPNVSMSNNLRIKAAEDKNDSLDKAADSKVKSNKDSKPVEERPKRKSSSTLDFDTLFSNPDSQFDDIDSFGPNYEEDFANIEASSGFAQPSDADLLFSTKPKAKPKRDLKPKPNVESKPKPESNVESKPPSQINRSSIENQESKPSQSKPITSIAKKEELENTTVVIYRDIGPIVGIDEKVYGPFLAKDVVILPNITAQILIGNKKAGLINI